MKVERTHPTVSTRFAAGGSVDRVEVGFAPAHKINADGLVPRNATDAK